MTMSGAHAINVELPDDLFERLREAAIRSDQPVEAVLVESLALLFGTPQAEPDSLDALPDGHLWALVNRRIAWPQGARLRELAASGRQATLSDEEQAELAALIDEADRLALLRSRALLELQRRGHAVRERLQLGA